MADARSNPLSDPSSENPEREDRGREGVAGGRSLVLLRFSGDITTKAPATRRRFIQRMRRNAREALNQLGIEHGITRTHNRIFVRVADENLRAAADALANVFGVQSLARVEEYPWSDLDDLVTTGVDLFSDFVRDRNFAVRARRVGERRRIPVRSEDLQRKLGAALLPGAKGVSLSAPEVTASIEVMAESAYFFRENTAGPGGLPLGCEGRAIALVSGGFDSAVAAWLIMKRGVALDYVFCNLGGRRHQLETLEVVKILADRWSHGTRPHFHAIDFDAVSRNIQARVTTRFWQIVLKRLMVRAAEAVATDREAAAIVTGEAIGQVSSQTLQNLAVISSGGTVPILRPLVGFNKDEIIEYSRRIGTHDLSAKVAEYCAIVPSKPATRASLAQIEAEEARLDPAILERALAERSSFDLRTLDLESLERPEIQIEEIPENAVVLDLRSKAAFQGWHHPDALFLDFPNALRSYRSMDPGRRYVLYCEFGLKSGHLAELMRREGMQAWHFAGGLKALVSYAKDQGIPTPDF